MPWMIVSHVKHQSNTNANDNVRNNGLEALGLPVIAYGPRVAVAEESFAA